MPYQEENFTPYWHACVSVYDVDVKFVYLFVRYLQRVIDAAVVVMACHISHQETQLNCSWWIVHKLTCIQLSVCCFAGILC